ncbi:MAG: hypothetical protein Q8L11_04275 [Candidatus Moranbacteria bacterium]|nr:hypothetical protein [bacterium]MDP1834114.1 hypothetical protein [Candidatus Moranbacteria bacterium]
MQKEISTDEIIEALGTIISGEDSKAAKEILKGLKKSHSEIIQDMLELMTQKALKAGIFFHPDSKVTVLDPAHNPNYSILMCPVLSDYHPGVMFRWAFTEVENGKHYLPDDTLVSYGYSDYIILLIDVAAECDSHVVRRITEMARQISPKTVVIVMAVISRGFTAESLGVDEFYPLLEL